MTTQANELPSPQTDKINGEPDEPSPRKPLRVWPGVVFVIVQWLAWFVVPFFLPDAILYAMMVAASCALAVVLWWLLLQPRALVRARRCPHPDCPRGDRNKAYCPRVDCNRQYGVFAFRHGNPCYEPRPRRSGSGQSSPLRRAAARGDRCGDPVRVRSVYAPPNRWCFWRLQKRFPLALVQNS